MVSKYYKIACEKCGTERIVFSKSDTKIKCAKCETELIEPTGSYAELKNCKKVEEFY